MILAQIMTTSYERDAADVVSEAETLRDCDRLVWNFNGEEARSEGSLQRIVGGGTRMQKQT